MNAFKILGCLFLMTVLSCSPTRKLQKSLSPQIEKSPIFSKSFTGFALLDPENGEFIYEYQSDKYFTPASNTKIFTLYTCLQILEERPAVLRYLERRGAVTIYGNGNPILLHPTLKLENPILNFLKKKDKPIYFSSSNFEDERFGSGWAWDDYPYYFQPEKSPIPIYGNVITLERDTINEGVKIYPDFFESNFILNQKIPNERPIIIREERQNKFSLNKHIYTGDYFKKEIPFIYSDSLLIKMLSKEIGKEVKLLEREKFDIKRTKIVRGNEIFPVYQKMMINSDNLLAEQLLLMCADKQFGVLNSKKIIAYAKDSIFQDLPDELLWRDGSGLSRYNMFTPRTIARLLEKMQQELPEEKLLSLFPVGGESGTLENWYGGKSEPYVFAKTGTLTGKHCLSGYIKTKTGKMLIFSFMHNNYKGSSKPLKKEMQRILGRIYEQY